MPTLDERVAIVEETLRLGREEHREFAETMDRLALQIAKLEVYLEQKNGGFTVSVKDKHVKFAGSLSLPWLVGIISAFGGGGFGLGKLFGAW